MILTAYRNRKRESRVSEPEGPLSERIRLSLMDDISTGALAPGTVLDEAVLADRFGASRTPVREALRQVEAAGLIEIRPRRGAIVLPMTLPRLLEMFEVTAEIEVMCTRLATHRITGLERAALAELHDASGAAAKAGDVEAYDGFNLAFHEGLYKATQNGFLLEQALALRARLLPFRRTQLRYPQRLHTSLAEHGAILRAMTRGEPEEAARAMREHMLNAGTSLARYLKPEKD